MEESLGRGLDAVARPEVDLIEIGLEDFALGIDALDIAGDFRLLRFAQRRDGEADAVTELVPRQLLRDRAAARTARAIDGVLERGTGEPQVVESLVAVESLVFDRDEGRSHVGRQIGEPHHRSPFLEELVDEASVQRVKL